MLAAILRPGDAGTNNADDHLEVSELALAQLPPRALAGPMLARSGSAGASHALADACRETRVKFCFGYRLLHVAGRLARHARRLTLHLPATTRPPPLSPQRANHTASWRIEASS